MTTMETTAKIPPPQIAPENQPFWDAANRGELLLKRCTACEKLHWYPRALCPFCFSEATEWVPSSGLGEVYSFTVSGDAIPAYIRLAEGVTMLSRIVGSPLAAINIGAAVKVCFAGTDGSDQKVPVFELANASEENA